MNLNQKQPNELPFILLPKFNLKILLDTGSSSSFIRPDIAKVHFPFSPSDTPLRVKTIHGISYTEFDTMVPCGDLFHSTNLNLRFHVFHFHSRFDLLLGLDNLKKLGASIDLRNNVLHTSVVSIPLHFLDLQTNETHLIKARQIQKIYAPVSNVQDGYAIVPYAKIGPVEIPECLVNVCNSKAYLYATNSSENPFQLTLNTPLIAEPITPISSVQPPNFNLIDKSPPPFDVNKLRLDDLNEEEKSAIVQLFKEFPDVIYQEGTPLGCTANVTHHIRTTDEIPTYAKNYRFPEIYREELDKQMDELIQQGIVRDSDSPWNAPLWIVPKKMDSSGKQRFRVVVDYRKLNDKTIEDKYPLPQISDLLDKLGRCQYFTTIDLKSGFHQIAMDPDSTSKTAFSTPTRHLEWTRVPFGLKNAPSTFQRVMDNVLRGIANELCCVYLDDIIVFSTSLQEHIDRLRTVLKRLRAANLKINLDKTHFLRREVAYLGHIVTPDGVKPNPDKISAIQNYPIPSTQKDIKSFLGLLGYYRKFIPNFAHLTKPMTHCLKKGRAIDVNDPEYQQCFQTCKTLLTNEPILQYPDFSRPFHLTTDASNVALGAVLSQPFKGSDKPLAYASRTLNDSERKYSAIEKELLAIVWAVAYFRPYLFGRHFTVYSDHRPLQWLFAIKEPSSRLFSWKTKLQAYDFDIIYKKGCLNVAADALSRIQLDTAGCTSLYHLEISRLSSNLNATDATNSIIGNTHSEKRESGSESDSDNTPRSVSDQTTYPNFLGNTAPRIPIKDQPLNPCVHQIVVKRSKLSMPNPVTIDTLFENKTRITLTTCSPTRDTDIVAFIKEYVNPKIKYGIHLSDESYTQFSDVLLKYFTHSDINMCRFTKLLTDVPQTTNQTKLIERYHTGSTNHRGIDETYERLKREFYWPNLKLSIQKFINNCEVCLRCKYERSPITPKLNITPTASRPLEILHIDKFTVETYKFLTIIDSFSRYAQAYPLNSSTSVEIVNGLMKFFAHHGVPTTIISDNGAEFSGSLVKDLMALQKIKIHYISSQHPESNGVIERFHSTLIEHIRLLSCREEFKGTPTGTKVNYALIAYNNSIHSVSKLTPFELLYGHVNNRSLTEIDLDQILVNDYLDQHKRRTKALYENMLSKFTDRKDEVADNINKHRKEIPEIPPEVFVKSVQRQNKTKQKYNKEDVREIDPTLKTALINPRHHNTKEKIHLSNIKTPRKFFTSKIDIAWDETLDRRETQAHKYGLKITRDNLITLKPGQWLDDMIINFYMEMIDERSRNNSNLPSTFCFNTFLYTKFVAEGYDGVRNFTRRSDIFEKDIIVIPIHEASRSHWTVVIIKPKMKQVAYLDSLSNNTGLKTTLQQNAITILDHVQSYLAFEHLERRNALLDSENWSTIQLLTVPQQTTSDDCGVFVCQFAKHVAQNRSLNDIDPNRIPQTRRVMCYEILTGTLH